VNREVGQLGVEVAFLQSEGFKSASCLGHYIGSQSSFKLRTARPAAERLVQSLNLDREIGSNPSFTYRVSARNGMDLSERLDVEHSDLVW
jgi:hypothetical protein